MMLSTFVAAAPVASTLARVVPEMVGPRLMALVPSHSNPSKAYEIRLGKDCNVYCTCPAWKFQKGVTPTARTCKHIASLRAQLASVIAK
jgi:hypothetical protein